MRPLRLPLAIVLGLFALLIAAPRGRAVGS